MGSYKYKVGMCGGCFAPLHLGHKHLIITASNQCEELYVVLSVSKHDKIPYEYRYRWLRSLTKDMSNVRLITIFDESTDKSVYDWETGCEDVKSKIGKPIDAVFVGSDYHFSDNPYEKNYKDSEIVYIDRTIIPVSSTDINLNPYKYWDYIVSEARSYYVKKVLVIGTESSGKSTLVRNLASYFNTSFVEEKGREVCEEVGGLDYMLPSDYLRILYGHKVDEFNKLQSANKLLFIDTDCITTNFFYSLSFGENFEFNSLVKYMNHFNSYDLVIYLDLNLDNGFVDDGYRIVCDDNSRVYNDLSLKSLFYSHGINFTVLKGSYQENFDGAVNLVNKLIRG